MLPLVGLSSCSEQALQAWGAQKCSGATEVFRAPSSSSGLGFLLFQQQFWCHLQGTDAFLCGSEIHTKLGFTAKSSYGSSRKAAAEESITRLGRVK